MNLWVDHKQNSAFRNGICIRPTLTRGKISNYEPLSLPSGCTRFQLVLPKTKLVSDLEFTHLEPYKIDGHEVEIQIKATALNFRDVFAVLKPIPLFEEVNSLGLDYAGVVVRTGEKVKGFKVGDRVIGMVFENNLSLPSHYKTTEKLLIPLPETMTFAEGATLPAVFFTVAYSLIYVAQIKKGDTILIHTASGGVGLAAIQICKYFGAYVIATAGTKRKRSYLRNLGIKHVFNSRTTDFKKDVLEVTNQRGVDLVLNSITGPGFKEASLDVLCSNGRFIEMSKLNVWTKEEVHFLRPDVAYEDFVLTTLSCDKLEYLTNALKSFLETESIRPIPYERFDAVNIRSALNYLEKAKHIGKVVCIMPDIKLDKSKVTITTPLFNKHSTYLVTGGLGGIGYEVVKWMLENGAIHIAIASRSPPTAEVSAQLEKWIDCGYHVRPFQLDIGNYEMCENFFEDLKISCDGFPPLRGVMHAAGVLHDAVLGNQCWETFEKTYNPKVNGSWNLHDLTREMLLEHFVLFSSIAANVGSPGQTNHSASNAFEDSLAFYRRSIGLPATCINWGNWGEVGVATEMDAPGTRPISTAQGLMVLDACLRTNTTHLSVFNVESFPQVLKLFPNAKHYFGDWHFVEDPKSTVIMTSDEFWRNVESKENRDEKLDCFKSLIKTVAKNILKLETDEQFADHAEFQSVGIDSLMMLEMKNGIQNTLGNRAILTANLLKDCNTPKILANALVDMMEAGYLDYNKIELSRDELSQLIRKDSDLFPKSLSIKSLKMSSIEEVETVLLTGATGNLGPYLLRDLSKRKQLKQVICLIRSTKNSSGFQRLKARLSQLQLEIDIGKVVIVDGDITSPMLGLNEKEYFSLCETTDAVVHSAVKSDHIVKFWKASETNKTHVRNVNVLGTLRLLEFAAEKRLKHFFHASTMLSFTGLGLEGKFSESWQHVSAFDELEVYNDLGYIISKHIAEQLVYKAVLSGIPCKAFRFPHISGDSKTGRIDYERNHMTLRWLSSMKLKLIHDLPTPVLAVPVDHCAKISLDIFFNPDAPMDAYNIVQKSFELEQVLVDVAERLGIKMEIVSYKTFLNALQMDKKSPVAPFVDMYKEKETQFIDSYTKMTLPVMKKFLEDPSVVFDPSRLSKYVLDYENMIEICFDVLLRDFTYLRNEGVFEKYGIC